MFEPHINGILWCDLGLLGAFIALERLGRVALCIVVCSCLMSFSMDQGPGRRPRKPRACGHGAKTRMPAVATVAQVQRTQICFWKARASESERIYSVAVVGGGIVSHYGMNVHRVSGDLGRGPASLGLSFPTCIGKWLGKRPVRLCTP